MISSKFGFYEFFAGGGMVRSALGTDKWDCLFANDFDEKKCATYAKNWGGGELVYGDVRGLKSKDLAGHANLAWASFPCQDLSLAGNGAGLRGNRSGSFWAFWDLMEKLVEEKRAPDIIALENVVGTITSHGGRDFEAICTAITQAGYRLGAVVVDAALFLPQSRPRLFIIGVRKGVPILPNLISKGASTLWHPKSLRNIHDKLPDCVRENWLWWSIPSPPVCNHRLADLIQSVPDGVSWHSASQTQKLLSMMSPVNLAKVRSAKDAKRVMVGTVYRRTRLDKGGRKVQRAEVRFDDVAGCLRTPGGGSSRQLIIVVDGETVRSRLISARETARLMGLPEEYMLPENYNEAYHLTGDGVVVPVVRHLADHIFMPLLSGLEWRKAAA